LNLKIPDWYENGNNPWYTSGRCLEEGIGNNAFSLEKKKGRSKLIITPLKIGGIDDLKVGKEIVFQDYDSEQWVECVGLESSILCLDYDFPIYIFDNHNHAFYAWCEAMKMNWVEKGSTLIHMDEHYDDQEPSNYRVDIDELADVWRYTNEELQIATYIMPAIKKGLLRDCLNYVESREFGVRSSEFEDCVVNLDIDIFHQDMSHISWFEKMTVLKKYLSKTKLMTIATSPHFMDQKVAISQIKKIIDEFF